MERSTIPFIILGLCTGSIFPDYVMKVEKDYYTDSTGYQFLKKVKGIELYEKWYKISKNQMAREVKAAYTLHTNIETAAALIEDEKKAILWNKGSSQFHIVPKDDNSWFCYIQYDLPWPVDNQDCVLQYNAYYFSHDQIVIDFKSVEHEIFPILKNVSRLNMIKGRWTFKEIPEGTRVEYFITTLPSTTLPRWVTDPIVRNNLVDTMDEFRKILEGIKN